MATYAKTLFALSEHIYFYEQIGLHRTFLLAWQPFCDTEKGSAT
jgi:hypothetical protein